MSNIARYPKRMSRKEAKLFKERWKLVNEKINEEIRNTPIETKLQQLAIMFGAGQFFDWTGSQEEIEIIRNRWQQLKERFNARKNIRTAN